MLSALTLRSPHPSYVPAGLPAPTAGAPQAAVVPDISVDDAMKKPQFYVSAV